MKKINLHCGEDIRNDCINIDMRSDAGLSCNIQDSYELNFEEGSCDEIIINPGGLESISKQDVALIIDSWKKCLKKGGSMWINFSDVRPLFNKVSYDRMPLEELESIIYKTKSLWDMKSVKNLVQLLGLSVSSINYIDFIGVIHATKD